MKKQSDHALATHTHKAASLKAKAAKVAVRGATQPRMPTPLQKITLTVLPLAGLLWTAPLAFAHDNEGEHGRVHNEFNEEHQEGHEALNAEYRAFNSQHRALQEDLNAQHEDYHDGNRYRNWVDNRLSEILSSKETPRSVFIQPPDSGDRV